MSRQHWYDMCQLPGVETGFVSVQDARTVHNFSKRSDRATEYGRDSL